MAENPEIGKSDPDETERVHPADPSALCRICGLTRGSHYGPMLVTQPNGRVIGTFGLVFSHAPRTFTRENPA
jgi:hypothetical protein